MSELINNTSKQTAKHYLLTSVSALAFAGLFSVSATAADNDRPTVWIEAGSQLDRLSDGQESFAPPFVATLLENPFTPPAKVQAPPRYSFGEEGRLSFMPNGSDWVFSASVRYGRANSSGNAHEETAPGSVELILSVPLLGIHQSGLLPPQAMRFGTTKSSIHDAYLILDFQAGKDVGLGLSALHVSSTLSTGIRFAQFTSQSNVRINADPNFAVTYDHLTRYHGIPGYFKIPHQHWNLFDAKLNSSRSFSGIGPSLEWSGNAALLGRSDNASITFDWALDGAVLFGRQKVKAHHQTIAYHDQLGVPSRSALPTVYHTSHDATRSHSVAIPNVGGFAGFSLRFPNAKVTLGYRVDAFFGAIDGGIDSRETYDRDFYGPFATISIGLP